METIPSWEDEYQADISRNRGQFASQDEAHYMILEIEALREQLAQYSSAGPCLPPLPQQLPSSVTRLPISTSYSPVQALQASLHEAPRLKEVIVLGQYFPEDGTDVQRLYVLGSRLDLGKALWIHRRFGLYIDENS